jgi:hypothetical protein
MKKFSQVGSCCITVGMQFPPEVPQVQMGFTVLIGQNVLVAPFFGKESLDYVLQQVSPVLLQQQRIDLAQAIQKLFEK